MKLQVKAAFISLGLIGSLVLVKKSQANPTQTLLAEAAERDAQRRREFIKDENNARGFDSKGNKGDKTTIDFEATDISGARHVPIGTLINQNRVDKGYDFVKMRESWHSEMLNSAASLDSDGGTSFEKSD